MKPLLAAFCAIWSMAATVGTTAPPAPLPSPLADDPDLRKAITDAGQCYLKQKPIEARARFDADAATRGLVAPAGSDEWLAAKRTVIAYIEARKDRMACITRFVPARTKNLSSRDDGIWLQAFSGWLADYEAETRFQLAIVERLAVGPPGGWELERLYASPR